MADSVQQLVTDVLEEGTFDVESSRALRWLTIRQRSMCAEARFHRRSVEIGPTVAAQAVYALPVGVVEVLEVTVDGAVLGKILHSDLPAGSSGFLVVSGSGQAFAPAEDDSGADAVALFPTPADAGLEVIMRAVIEPPDLVIGQDDTIVVPSRFTDTLVSGAIAQGLGRTEQRPDLAAYHEGIYQSGVAKLTRETARKMNGSGPTQIRVAGVDC